MFAIALANQKGGVGKTTNAINVAGALAARDHDVLLADFDPQGYLTLRLGLREQYRDGSADLAEAIAGRESVDRGALLHEHAEFDVVPGDESLRSLMEGRPGDPGLETGDVARFLEAAAGDRYDVAVVDTPPVQNAFTDVLLADCGDVFVPMGASEASIHSIRSLVDRIVDLERETGAGVRIRAVLLSNVTYPLDNEQRRVAAWAEENFGDSCPVYEIRHRAAIQRSLNAGGSIFGHDAEPTDMTAVYDEVAAQIERLHPAGPLGEEQ